MATRKQEIEHLAKLMNKIDIAMLTTIGKGGHLVSRPLSTQCATFDGERVWFMSEADTPKVGEIRRQPKVNVAYASKDANTYLSIAGEARAVRDQALIDRFWNDAMKAFFPKGKDDPNVILIEVAVDTIEYWDGPGSWLGKALTFAVARVTGKEEVMGENRIVDLRKRTSRKPPSSEDAPKKRATKRSSKRSTATGTAKKAGAKKAATARSGKTGPAKRAATRSAPGAKKKTAAAKKTASAKSASKRASKPAKKSTKKPASSRR
ncbi:pyridoxamine 5'-phosphate oxidase family protein [Luteimonas viscosa]|uniref:Pyridoxamine 5'-phosphate oxidase family protein n=1 Tax=Luteimonas viscosa TaxID=1132694 RepID=A0A5D4XV80_9GAMM|nr:pyridoxamine 5'-phosphate oxidase family protein [Luteimonas viscosa]